MATPYLPASIAVEAARSIATSRCPCPPPRISPWPMCSSCTLRRDSRNDHNPLLSAHPVSDRVGPQCPRPCLGIIPTEQITHALTTDCRRPLGYWSHQIQ